MQNQSEVARILSQITAEYEAAQRGLEGFAEGTARHDFINHKMGAMQTGIDDLAAMIGKQQAMEMIKDTLGYTYGYPNKASCIWTLVKRYEVSLKSA
jgi:hypothetical protein